MCKILRSMYVSIITQIVICVTGCFLVETLKNLMIQLFTLLFIKSFLGEILFIHTIFSFNVRCHCAFMGLDRWCTSIQGRFCIQVKPNHIHKVENDVKKYFDEHFLSYGAFFFRAKQAIFRHFKSPFKALLDIRLTSNFE